MVSVAEATPPDANQPSRLVFAKKRQFAIKTALLAATTVALIPILLAQSALAAQIYLISLVVIHVGGLAIFAIGVSREDIAPSRRGFIGRLAGLAVAIALLYLASTGLHDAVGSAIFWTSLFSIWAVHTAALALLHIRGRPVGEGCPFV